MTSETPYIKGLYYPINEQPNGIEKRRSDQLILQGFSLAVNPRQNLSLDGQLFVEMCEKDKEFCSLVTKRSSDKDLSCMDFWVEDLVHENYQWKIEGSIINDRNISCPFNPSLLYQLRDKFRIKLLSTRFNYS